MHQQLLGERVSDGQLADTLAVLKILGKKYAASRDRCGRDNQAVVKGKAMMARDLDRRLVHVHRQRQWRLKEDFQGVKGAADLIPLSPLFSPRDIDAVILTHAHLDHSGYLPRLVRDGFRGKIYATEATKDVADLILKDSGHLQEKDADFLNRHHLSKHSPALPLYGVRDAQRAIEQFSTVEFDKTIQLPNGASLRFRHAGHILGAAHAEVHWGGRCIVFSGDVGRYGDPLFADPVSASERH